MTSRRIDPTSCVFLAVIALACADDPDPPRHTDAGIGGTGAHDSGSGGSNAAGSSGSSASGGTGGIGGGGGHDLDGGSEAQAGSGGSSDAAIEDAAPDSGFDGPLLLSETGLYADIADETLASGVQPFEPRFALWSDGATKRRWLFLPPGTTIDTSDVDYWVYPEGTKAWKEFSRGSTRVETRLLEKLPGGQWRRIAYLWNAAGTDAVATPQGLPDARGTEHDVPSTEDCERCHGNMPDTLLGVTAIQLDHVAAGATLASLAANGRLSDVPVGPLTLPGDSTAQTALGYLHANCGLCHNPRSDVAQTIDMYLWLTVESLGSVTMTPTYLTTVNVMPSTPLLGAPARVLPGNPTSSAVSLRMSLRGTGQMPPLASEIVDPTGRAAVDGWIGALP